MLPCVWTPVATCWDKLGVASSNLKMVKFFMQHFLMLHDVVRLARFVQQNVAHGHAQRSFDGNLQ